MISYTLDSNYVQLIMHEFHATHARLPNTLIVPANQGVDAIRIESLFGMKIIYAAVDKPQVCLR